MIHLANSDTLTFLRFFYVHNCFVYVKEEVQKQHRTEIWCIVPLSNFDGTKRMETAEKKPRTRRKQVVVHRTSPHSPFEGQTGLDIRKPVNTILVRNRAATAISLLERKAVNNLLGYAQHISRLCPTVETDSYRMPMPEFEHVMGFKPNNRSHLLKTLSAIQDMKVEFNFEHKPSKQGATTTDTALEPVEPKELSGLLGVANIISEIYFDSKSKEIVFSLPPIAKKFFLRPDQYLRIKSILMNQFTSHAALALHEAITRYISAPIKRTRELHWREWSIALSGAVEPHANFREFNKMLTRAITQVNAALAIEGFTVVPHTTLKGKQTDTLWFELEPVSQSSLDLDRIPMSVSTETKDSLLKIGLIESKIAELVIRYSEEYVMAQYDYLRKRMLKTSKEKVGDPKAFFMSALEKNYADAPLRDQEDIKRRDQQKKDEKKVKPPPTAEDLMKAFLEAWKAEKTLEVREHFDNQPVEQKQAIADAVLDDLKKHPQVWKMYKNKGIEAPLVKAEIIRLVIERDITQPNAAELMAYAIQKGLITTTT